MKYGRVVLKNFVALCASVGFQIQFAMPIIENSNDTVTTSFTVSVVPCKPRKIATSKNAPNNGPSTSSTTAIDSRRGPVPLEAELPVREGAQHADGAVREVEDARRRVREHEAARRDREDRRQGQAGDRVAQELRHAGSLTKCGPGRPAGPVRS